MPVNGRSLARDPVRVMTVVGTRPEAIKMAPVLYELRRHPSRFDSMLVSAGQHKELLAQALHAFDLRPDVELGLMRSGQSLSGYAARALEAVADVVALHKPEIILVQGDTTTVAMTALAAFYNGIIVGHIEAGLRSFDRANPFPEEMNRELAGLIADIHFAPTEQSRLNLVQKGVPPASVLNTGNTIVDAVQMLSTDGGFDDPAVARLIPRTGRLIVVTVHRRETFGTPLRNVCLALREIAAMHKDVHIVLPVHPNPLVSNIVHSELGRAERISVIPAVSYGDMLRLMRAAYLLLSDSGGIQEEAPSLNVPLLVLRDVTERPEVVEAGLAKLVGTSTQRIATETARLLTNETEYGKMRGAPNPYGDGHAAERIVEAVWQLLQPVPKAEQAALRDRATA